ncbi:MAG: class I SAM-dependent methyltransferase [Thaumarchaeota archaeon]|nr:class I SAM-dependent methyltransferase [Nitrososphaerota archaeon]
MPGRTSREQVLKSSRSYYSHRARYRDLFDQLKGKDPDTDKEMRFIESAFSRNAKRRVRDVLDVACGGGRHVVALAKRGYNCVGYDFTPQRIRAAKARASRMKVRVKLAVGDATKMKFDKNFDAVLACYILFLLPNDGDIEKCLSGAYKALRDGGIVICSLYNPFTTGKNWILAGARNETLNEEQTAPGMRITEIQSTRDYDPVKGVVWINWTTFIEAPDGQHVFRDQERARLLTYWDMVHYLRAAGFGNIECYPDWRIRPTKKPKAEQLVFVARKDLHAAKKAATVS